MNEAVQNKAQLIVNKLLVVQAVVKENIKLTVSWWKQVIMYSDQMAFRRSKMTWEWHVTSLETATNHSLCTSHWPSANLSIRHCDGQAPDTAICLSVCLPVCQSVPLSHPPLSVWRRVHIMLREQTRKERQKSQESVSAAEKQTRAWARMWVNGRSHVPTRIYRSTISLSSAFHRQQCGREDEC